VVKAAEEGKADAEKPRQVGEVSGKGGRGKIDEVKAKAVAIGKKKNIGKRTMERAYAETKLKAKATGKHSKRRRRTDPEIKRDGFLRFVNVLDAQNLIEATDPVALNLLTTKQRADAIEVIETAIARLRKIIDRLRSKDHEAA
jgi:hypothetical protein